jgi:hypothetical protein
MYRNGQETAFGLDGRQGFSTNGADAPRANFTGERRAEIRSSASRTRVKR